MNASLSLEIFAFIPIAKCVFSTFKYRRFPYNITKFSFFNKLDTVLKGLKHFILHHKDHLTKLQH